LLQLNAIKPVIGMALVQANMQQQSGGRFPMPGVQPDTFELKAQI
jgi:hypothetical protein